MGCLENTKLDTYIDTLDATTSQQIHNFIRDDIIGNGGKIIPRDQSKSEKERVKILKQFRDMVTTNSELYPNHAKMVWYWLIFNSRDTPPGALNKIDVNSSRTMIKQYKRLNEHWEKYGGSHERISNLYADTEGNKGKIRQWFLTKLDNLIPSYQTTSPHVLGFQDPTGWAEKITLDTIHLNETMAQVARPFVEHIKDEYHNMELLWGRMLMALPTLNDMPIYIGDMEVNGEPMGWTGDDRDSDRTTQSQANLVSFLSDLQRGKKRFVVAKEMKEIPKTKEGKQLKKNILDMATRRMIRVKEKNGKISTYTGNVFTYRNKDTGKIDPDYILFKFLKKGKDGNVEPRRLKISNLIGDPVTGEKFVKTPLTTVIETPDGIQTYVMIQKYNGDVEYWDMYNVGYQTEIDDSGNEVTTDTPLENKYLADKISETGWEIAGQKMGLIDATMDIHSEQERLLKSRDGQVSETNRKRRYWDNWEFVDQIFNNGPTGEMTEKGVIENHIIDKQDQNELLNKLMFPKSHNIAGSGKDELHGLFTTWRNLRHIMSGKIENDPNDLIDWDSLDRLAEGFNFLRFLRLRQRITQVRREKGFIKAKKLQEKNNKINKEMNIENQAPMDIFLEEMETAGSSNPYNAMFINMWESDFDPDTQTGGSMWSLNSYLGKDNMYFPDMYHDTTYSMKLQEALAKVFKQQEAWDNELKDVNKQLQNPSLDMVEYGDLKDQADSINLEIKNNKSDKDEIQSRYDMSVGLPYRSEFDGQLSLIQKERHNVHRKNLMDRNNARTDSRTIIDYINNAVRSTVINGVKADYYNALGDPNLHPDWVLTLHNQIKTSIGVPNERAGLGISFTDAEVAEWLTKFKNYFGDHSPITEQQVQRFGVLVGKYLTASLMQSTSYTRNYGQSVQKSIGFGIELFTQILHKANRQEFVDSARASGILSIETYLGDAIFTHADPDWIMGNMGAMVGIYDFLRNKQEGGFDAGLGRKFNQEEMDKFDSYIYKLILQYEKGEASKGKIKKKFIKDFGKNAWKAFGGRKKVRNAVIAGSSSPEVINLIKLPEIKIKIANMKKDILSYIGSPADGSGFIPTGDYDTDLKNFTNLMKKMKLSLVESHINKLVKLKLSRFYLGKPTGAKQYGEDLYTFTATEQQLRIEDWIAGYIRAVRFGLVNDNENMNFKSGKVFRNRIVDWMARSEVLMNDFQVISAGNPEMYRGMFGKVIMGKFQTYNYSLFREETRIVREYWDSLPDEEKLNTLHKLGILSKDIISSPFEIFNEKLKIYKQKGLEGMSVTKETSNYNSIISDEWKNNPKKRRLYQWLYQRFVPTLAYESMVTFLPILAITEIYHGVLNAVVGRETVQLPSKLVGKLMQGSWRSVPVTMAMRLMTLFWYLSLGDTEDEEDDWLSKTRRAGRGGAGDIPREIVRNMRGMPFVPLAFNWFLQFGFAIADLTKGRIDILAENMNWFGGGANLGESVQNFEEAVDIISDDE